MRILFTSRIPSTGVTSIASKYAIYLATQGLNVALVDNSTNAFLNPFKNFFESNNVKLYSSLNIDELGKLKEKIIIIDESQQRIFNVINLKNITDFSDVILMISTSEEYSIRRTDGFLAVLKGAKKLYKTFVLFNNKEKEELNKENEEFINRTLKTSIPRFEAPLKIDSSINYELDIELQNLYNELKKISVKK